MAIRSARLNERRGTVSCIIPTRLVIPAQSCNVVATTSGLFLFNDRAGRSRFMYAESQGFARILGTLLLIFVFAAEQENVSVG